MEVIDSKRRLRKWERLLNNAAPIFFTPVSLTTRNNIRWVNGRDQLIPKKL
jgi:hypothetical protein